MDKSDFKKVEVVEPEEAGKDPVLILPKDPQPKEQTDDGKGKDGGK